MKACPLCGSTYADRVDFCFQDGAPLLLRESRPDAPTGTAASIEPPSAPAEAPGLAGAAAGVEDRDPTDLPEPHSLGGWGGAPEDAPEPGAMRASEPVVEPVRARARQPGLVDAPPIADPVETISIPTAANLKGSAPSPTAVPEGSDPRLQRAGLVEMAPMQAQPGRASSSPTLIPDLAATDAPRRQEQTVPDLDLDEDLAPPEPIAATPVAPLSPGVPARQDASPAIEPVPTGAGRSALRGGDRLSTPDERSVAGADLTPRDRPGPPWTAIGFGLVVLFAVGAYALYKMGEPEPVSVTAAEVAVEPEPIASVPAPVALEPEVTNPLPVPEAEGPATAALTPEPAEPAPTPPVVAAVEPVPVPTPAESAPPTPTPPAPAPPAPVSPTPPPPTANSTAATAGTATPPPTQPAEPETEDGTAEAGPWGNQPAQQGALAISTVPPGARITVDGTFVGRSPITVPASLGNHTVRAELDGYTVETRTIEARGAQTSLPFELRPVVVTGRVHIFGVTGAEVLVDGSSVGTIPKVVTLSEGSHVFQVITQDGRKFTKTHEIRFQPAGTTVEITLRE